MVDLKKIFNKISLYYHTIKYLKASQLFFRVYFKFRRFPKTKENLEFEISKVKTGFVRTPEMEKTYLGDDIFKFLNLEGEIGNWNDQKKSKLWLYNLHYFDFLNNHSDITECNRIIKKWIKDNPIGYGNGWEPYPLSLRIVNLVKYYISNPSKNTNELHSLYLQSVILSRSIEYHILGNHLLANAKALIFSGLFFKGTEPKRWLKKGLDILQVEIPEQILNDGAHFELSPMYHNIILSDFLDIYNLLKCYDESLPLYLTDAINQMLSWSDSMTHPDGDIAFFNDAAFKIAAKPNQLFEYANRLGCVDNNYLKCLKTKSGHTFFKDSGYFIFQNQDMKSLLDLARVGPDYLPGHAHADTLSFETSFFGQRVFVNSGTSVYGEGRERLRQRSTSAHNTVDVDSFNSSEVWGGFRVAKRAIPSIPDIAVGNNSISVKCSHNGYHRLSGKVTHVRTWSFSSSEIKIFDYLKGDFSSARVNFILHPSIRIEKLNSQKYLLKLQNNKCVYFSSNSNLFLEDYTWHPEFGKSIKTKKIVIAMSSKKTETIINF
ncbi:alginate lyase family protein [Vibrio parahaemolyticus]|uniref:Heparin-sulfate lyase n=2 Tax=Vibrio parahaemolyticus TaxID=670 RepID=A0A7M1VRL6_VIBPH|nr:alginate lyase family protein [Vibrio parahaemolyticus]MDF4689821.1 alginate lyase family protein [Vibrio parahaemolyticus]MDF4968492.1 alginate lyase family protein [Vibrio parahaemolyticus]QOS17199.1 heparin-sulfate lyase [Vibrio parahaemolyticus]